MASLTEEIRVETEIEAPLKEVRGERADLGSCRGWDPNVVGGRRAAREGGGLSLSKPVLPRARRPGRGAPLRGGGTER